MVGFHQTIIIYLERMHEIMALVCFWGTAGIVNAIEVPFENMTGKLDNSHL
jgi:hypothetical protein